MFEERIVDGMRLVQTSSEGPGALRLQLRLPWYRSLPLACVERLELAIDGAVLPPDELTIVMNGARYPLPTIGALGEVWWFVLDVLEVELEPSRQCEPGIHEVNAAIDLLVPYGDGDFRPELNIRQTAICTKELHLAGRDE